VPDAYTKSWLCRLPIADRHSEELFVGVASKGFERQSAFGNREVDGRQTRPHIADEAAPSFIAWSNQCQSVTCPTYNFEKTSKMWTILKRRRSRASSMSPAPAR
jgi:hypothetical protein